MIVNTKTGLLVTGVLGKEPELRQVGSSAVLKLSVRYGFDPPSEPGGKRAGKFLDVDVWDGAEELDGMLAKGDAVIATGDELKSREYGGKTYYSLRANGLFPGAGVVFRWMQQIVDMIPPAAAPASEFAPVNEPTPFDAPTSGAMYPGEQLSDYAPDRSAPPADPLGNAPVVADDEDLPF
ncbi:MAG: hypothetical protein IJ347_09385 [Faecalibacterium sp.]|nr:hypothetical protein [Faecalibacterium sp.]